MSQRTQRWCTRFIQWMVWSVPFAIASAVIAQFVQSHVPSYVIGCVAGTYLANKFAERDNG